MRGSSDSLLKSSRTAAAAAVAADLMQVIAQSPLHRKQEHRAQSMELDQLVR